MSTNIAVRCRTFRHMDFENVTENLDVRLSNNLCVDVCGVMYGCMSLCVCVCLCMKNFGVRASVWARDWKWPWQRLDEICVTDTKQIRGKFGVWLGRVHVRDVLQCISSFLGHRNSWFQILGDLFVAILSRFMTYMYQHEDLLGSFRSGNWIGTWIRIWPHEKTGRHLHIFWCCFVPCVRKMRKLLPRISSVLFDSSPENAQDENYCPLTGGERGSKKKRRMQW